MKAIRIDDGTPTLVDVAEPSGDGIAVSVQSASICGSDLHLIDLGFVDGRIIGHEFAGTTPDGTAVAVEPILCCGACASCVDGSRGQCRDGGSFIGISTDGGLAETVIVPPSLLVELPTGLAVADAALVEPFAVAVHGVRRAQVQPDDRVLVIGAGPIGLATAAVLAERGHPVDIVARHPHQQEAADRVGASLTIDDGYDVVVDAVATTDSLAQAVAAARVRGRIVLVGSLWAPAELDMSLCMKEVSIVPAIMYSGHPPDRDVDEAARVLATNGRGFADAIITHRFPLEGVTEAFATARDRKGGAIKVAFEIG